MLPDRDMLSDLSTHLDLDRFTLRNPTRRREVTLSSLRGYFSAPAALEKAISDTGDAVVYEVEVVEPKEQAPNILAYGVTRVFPGRVGNECYMTKGHFHADPTCTEIYLALAGRGGLLQMTRDGRSFFQEMRAGDAVYVRGDMAHRLVNTGDDAFVTWAVYPVGAGHDYSTIAERGFSSLVVGDESGAHLAPNPRWA